MEPDDSEYVDAEPYAPLEYAEPVPFDGAEYADAAFDAEYLDHGAGVADDGSDAATGWPMASPAGEDLRLSYPQEGGPFRYEAGPQPEEYPITDLSGGEIDQALSGLDALAAGQTPAEGTADAGELQQVDMARFDPMSEQNQGKAFRSPLEPPAPAAYGSAAGAPDATSYHGAMGRDGVDAEGQPVYHPAEEFSVTRNHPTYAVRVGPGGAYVDHVFDTKEEALAYAQQVAGAGRAKIRQDSALPEQWPSGSAGNPVDAVRVFEIPPNTPFLRSGVAPQPESAEGMTDVIYEGGGGQVQLPYGTVGRDSPAVAEFPIS